MGWEGNGGKKLMYKAKMFSEEQNKKFTARNNKKYNNAKKKKESNLDKNKLVKIMNWSK